MYLHPTLIRRSKTLRCIEWTGDVINVNHPRITGDSHPMTWGADDEIYIGTGDPNYFIKDGEITRDIQIPLEERPKYYNYTSGSCFERIVGTPENFTVERLDNLDYFRGWSHHGSKPTGMISVNGTLYYALQNTLGWKPARYGNRTQHGSDAVIISTKDYGKTWEPDLNGIMKDFRETNYEEPNKPKTEWYERMGHKGWYPMFPGDWFGGPTFVQFGKDNADAIDDYVYAISSDQFENGTGLRVGRVPNDKILDRDAWEFAIKLEDGDVEWTKNLYESTSVLDIYRHISVPEMVYVKSIKKFLLVTWALHSDFHPTDGSELTILESDHPWGPFSLVHYEWMWYKQEAGYYCPRIPLKWFNQDTLEGYMEMAGNWETQPAKKTYYLPQVRKFKILRMGELSPDNPEHVEPGKQE